MTSVIYLWKWLLSISWQNKLFPVVFGFFIILFCRGHLLSNMAIGQSILTYSHICHNLKIVQENE